MSRRGCARSRWLPAPSNKPAFQVTTDDASADVAVRSAVHVLRTRCAARPLVGLILGSGLGDLADQVEGGCVIPFADIPHHPTATVPGHAGQVIFGRLEGVEVAVWRGRIHFYEGRSMAEVGLPIRLLHALGARALVLTNAAGGLNDAFLSGDLMLITDHINLPGLVGHNPLRGPNPGREERFIDLAHAYDPDLRALALRVAAAGGLTLRQGVYAMAAGPSYETPAEARMLRLLGADAVGMSTAPEVIVARQLGLRVVALSAITNVLLGPAAAAGTSHAEVVAAAERLKPRLAALVRGMLSSMGQVLTP
jgi:purine-nucleoside phosphorylase